MNNYPACPECEHLADVSKESNKIGDFLSWLQESGIVLATWQNVDEFRDEILLPYRKSIERILADYFEINLDLVEKERAALLEYLRNKED